MRARGGDGQRGQRQIAAARVFKKKVFGWYLYLEVYVEEGDPSKYCVPKARRKSKELHTKPLNH